MISFRLNELFHNIGGLGAKIASIFGASFFQVRKISTIESDSYNYRLDPYNHINIDEKEYMQIQKVALEWLEKNINNYEWKDDDWYTITDNLDINVWEEPDDGCHDNRFMWRASVYFVKNGLTITDGWVRIPLFKLNV